MTSFFCTRQSYAVLLLVLAVGAIPVAAQVTTGTIYGRIVDASGGALPGVTVQVVNPANGVNREIGTRADGTYQFPALPHGQYKLTATLSGFQTTEAKIAVYVSVNQKLDITMEVKQVNEVINVTAQTPPSSSVGTVVDMERGIQLPLIVRSAAGLAALTPGVGLGLHSDPARGQPVAPMNGGNGRSSNILFDGGDNNDGTVGGASMTMPLEAIGQFDLHTQRFSAQYSHGNSVFNVVTKSGDNQMRGSWFTAVRDDALNARTFSEKRAGVEKQPYERYQYGGSLGGPIMRNRAHFFAAYERNQQDTQQVVNTQDTLPGDGIYAVPFRQNLFTTKVTSTPSPSHYLAVRYAYEGNTQPSGAAANTAYTTWVTSTNTYHSVNVNHNWLTGRSAVNELVVQYSQYLNDTPANQPGAAYTLLSGAKGGANANAPQSTEQKRLQVRDDFAWMQNALGGTHHFRTGVSILHTPRLFISNQGGTEGILTLRSNDINGGVGSILLIGGSVQSNIPTNLFGAYVQDDWRVTDRLTLNLGLRYDYMTGMPIEQTSTNFLNMQAAGQTGRFAGTMLEDFGKSRRNDANNVQPRVGAVYDLFGNGRDLIRGGWGIYTETSYTNANVLTTSLEGSGIIYSDSCGTTSAPTNWCDPSRGFIFPVGSPRSGELYTALDSVHSLMLPTFTPTTGEVVSPRLQQPFSYQTNVGWSHELGRTTTINVDYVRVDGRNINMRMRPNVDIDPSSATVRYLAGVGVSPNSNSFRTALSAGRSKYDALMFSGNKRMSHGFDLSASYTWSRSLSDVGTAADELAQNLLQDVNNPFSDFQLGPSTRVDARHRVTASAIVRLPYDFQVASVMTFRSALPVTTLEGQDLNLDGANNDHSPLAYRFTGLNDDGSATFEEAGTCETVNCSRRAPFSQVDLRISRSFRIGGTARIEALAEIFNVFNAINPFLPLSTTRLGNPAFMQPTAFAGDAGMSEQRIAQLGVRLSF